MPRLKRLSGVEVIKILEKFGFEVHSQRGDHVKMRRITETGKETLTIPKHKQLDTGTCRAILKQASHPYSAVRRRSLRMTVGQYISRSELAQYFYD